MSVWIYENGASLIVGGIAAAVVILIIVKLIRDKKKGKSSCGCDCAQCGGVCGCHSEKKK